MNTEDKIRRWISYQLESDGSVIEQDGVEYLDERGRCGLVLRDVDGVEWEISSRVAGEVRFSHVSW